MSEIIYVFAFLLGAFYGTKIKHFNQVTFALFGVLIAFGIGNYPYYGIQGVSTIYVSTVLGLLIGNWRNG